MIFVRCLFYYEIVINIRIIILYKDRLIQKKKKSQFPCCDIRNVRIYRILEALKPVFIYVFHREVGNLSPVGQFIRTNNGHTNV